METIENDPRVGSWYSDADHRPCAIRPMQHTRGPVTLRREQIEPTTTDQRLLDSSGDGDLVHTDPWRVLRILSEFVEGFGTLANLGPAISIFGSARTEAASGGLNPL